MIQKYIILENCSINLKHYYISTWKLFYLQLAIFLFLLYFFVFKEKDKEKIRILEKRYYFQDIFKFNCGNILIFIIPL